MRFRPLPVMTLAALPALALLIALGGWQVQRAQWKADLIAGYETRAAGEARTLAQAACGAAPAEGPVALDSPPEAGEIRVYGAGPEGTPGWLILRPAPADCAGDRQLVLVQTGFETLNGDRREAPLRLTLEPWPEIGPFTPANDPARGQYYRFDRADLAAALDADPAALSPVWARWDTRAPAERARIAPADHIGYAVTWFGLALALVAIYAALHVRAGRLSFGRKR